MASVAICILGLGVIASVDITLLPSHILAGLTAGLIFWLIGAGLYRVTTQDMLGLGDAKLFGAGGIWVGFHGLPTVLLLGALTALAYAILSGRRRKRVPFGPFLAWAVVAVWLFGPIGI